MPHHDARAIANVFIDLAAAKGEKLTHMAIQKLVYIAHGWNFAFSAEVAGSRSPLIEDPIEAWDWGPVIPSIWDSLKRYGNKEISEPIHVYEWKGSNFDRGPEVRQALTNEEREIVEMVYQAYGHLTGGRLSEITHEKNTPWSAVYRPGIKHIPIPNDLIAQYYRDLRAAAA